MNSRVILCISLLVFCTTLKAAPLNSTPTSQWLKMASDPRFQPYNSTLLDQRVMPFLAACYSPDCCKPNDEYSCKLFFDVVSWARDMDIYPNFTKTNVAEALKSQTLKAFCPALVSKYDEIHKDFNHNAPYDTSNADIDCIMGCGGDMQTKTARPPCTASLWLLNSIQPIAEKVKQMQQNSNKQQPLAANILEETDNEGGEDKGENAELTLAEMPRKGNSKIIDQTPKKTDSIEPPIKKEDTSLKVEPKDSKNIKAKPNTDKQIKDEPKDTNPDSQNPKNPVKTITPSTLESDVQVDAEDVTPLLESRKVSTDSTPESVVQEIDKKDKHLLDPSEEFYGDVASNENKPNPVDQMDDLNEQDNSLARIENPENDQTRKIDNHFEIVDGFKEEPRSNFFFFFLSVMFGVILGYVVYNNKTKIVALILEGRRSQGGRNGRRKHTAAYRKLDSNLEEAIMSAPSGRTTQVIY